MRGTRDHDVVLFGATGFTGALTARYLAAQDGVRWALAGRNAAKLAELRDRIGVEVPIVLADLADADSLRRLAESTRVVATTVGPYVLYGEPLVAACAQTGTDYVDLTGEPEFVDRMYLRHHETAVRTGARLVHACGFDSIPHDLGAQFTVQQLTSDRPIEMRGYVRAGGAASGGTFASAVNAFARTRQASAVHRERKAAEGRPAGRRTRAISGRPGYDRSIGKWVLPLPTIDPQIVMRSARALPEYGPDFSYGHFVALRSPLAAGALVAGVGTAFALAQLPPTRKLLLQARPPGTGPDEQRRARGWFKVRFVATAGDRRVVTEVAGGDPGYTETAKMLAESALCLAGDDLPPVAGQVTTAVAMGAVLRSRLERAGITFNVLESS
ncbi:MAG TPA: saccharopine dehydrogenase NADP-binding domain-containing protein [Micromonosporaceae bacterium]